MISDDHEFVFVDIVKTGGTSINAVLKQFGGLGKHHSIGRHLPRLAENANLASRLSQDVVNGYFCFTVVRNPYDRLISLYSYCQTAPLQKRFQVSRWAALCNGRHRPLPINGLDRREYWPTDFTAFVNCLTRHRYYYCDFEGEKYITMKAWLVDSTNNVRMDYIARYENLQADFDQITKLIGIPPQALPTENVSQLKSKREAALAILHNDDLRELITDYFADDFEEFEYSTDFSNSDSFELYCRKK